VLLLAALVLALPDDAAASGPTHGWRRPLRDGVAAGSFSFDPAAPYARGRRRGIDLRGAPGAPVLAACDGTVTYAGRVPGRGLGVTLHCGGLVATELGLRAPAVRTGARVAAGAPVGLLGTTGVLRLGARRAGDRHGYVDPAALLGADAGRPHDRVAPAPPPVARSPRRSPRPPAARSEPSPHPVPPWPAWLGAGLLVAGLAYGIAARAAVALGGRCPSTSRRPSTTSTPPRIWATRTRRSPPT